MITPHKCALRVEGRAGGSGEPSRTRNPLTGYRQNSSPWRCLPVPCSWLWSPLCLHSFGMPLPPQLCSCHTSFLSALLSPASCHRDYESLDSHLCTLDVGGGVGSVIDTQGGQTSQLCFPLTKCKWHVRAGVCEGGRTGDQSLPRPFLLFSLVLTLLPGPSCTNTHVLLPALVPRSEPSRWPLAEAGKQVALETQAKRMGIR